MQNRPTKSLSASNELALISDMVLASGVSTTGSFAFELI